MINLSGHMHDFQGMEFFFCFFSLALVNGRTREREKEDFLVGTIAQEKEKERRTISFFTRAHSKTIILLLRVNVCICKLIYK
jgi:hypothetical protein